MKFVKSVFSKTGITNVIIVLIGGFIGFTINNPPRPYFAPAVPIVYDTDSKGIYEIELTCREGTNPKLTVASFDKIKGGRRLRKSGVTVLTDQICKLGESRTMELKLHFPLAGAPDPAPPINN